MHAHQVDVWIWSLDDPVRPGLTAALSEDEQRRALRFAAPLDASRFISGRSVLRDILARYVEMPPGRLQFSYGPHGKPALCGSGPRAPCFNLSHSGHLAALAVCRDAELGIDIELIRPMTENVAQFFTPAERQGLADLSGADAVRRLFDLWTCKEALVKALGSGLTVPLDRYEIAFEAGLPARVLDGDLDPKSGRSGHLRQFEPGPGYAGAIAIWSVLPAITVTTRSPTEKLQVPQRW